MIAQQPVLINIPAPLHMRQAAANTDRTFEIQISHACMGPVSTERPEGVLAGLS